MSIYLVINDLGKVGGLQTVVINLSKVLLENGHDVKIISASQHKATDNNDIEVITLGLPKIHNLNYLKKVFWYLLCAFRFYNFSKKLKNDTFIGIGTIINIVMFSRFSQVIATEHRAYANNNILVRFLRKLTYSKFKKIIILSHHDFCHYKRLNEDTVVIPNFVREVVDVDYCEASNRILFVGMLSKVKGSDYLLDIINKAVSNNQSIHFDIVGSGPDFDYCVKYIASSSISDRVTMHGCLSDVGKLYRSAAMLVLTSRSEGFPMVLLEAQSFGIPVISFDCETGPSDIVIDSYNGYLIDCFDVNKFSTKLIEFFDMDSEMRKAMSYNSLVNVRKFYPNQVVRLWNEILK